MSITTYSELQTAIAGWLVRGDLTARIPDFIALFEAYAQRELRTRQMEQRDTAAVVDELGAPTEYGTIPTDHLETKTLSMTDGTDVWWLEPKPDEVIDEARVRAGKPRFYAEVGDSFRFYPKPDAVYTAQLTYFAQIPPLSVSNPTNWLLSLAPDAYLAGALTEAAPMLRDADFLGVWQPKREEALASVRRTTRTRAGKLRTEVPISRMHHFGIFDITRGV